MKPYLSCVLLLFLVACGSSPKAEFLTLTPVPPSQPAPKVSGPEIVVDAVHLPGSLDRLSFVRQATPTRLDVSDKDRWAAPLDDMSRRVLAEDLRLRLPPGMIAPPDAHRGGGYRSLAVGVQRFAPDESGKVSLDAEWSLTGWAPNAPALQDAEKIEEPGGASAEAQALAMSRALGTLADRIVAALATNGRTAEKNPGQNSIRLHPAYPIAVVP